MTGRAFLAILWRDLFVTGKEFWAFLFQVAVQPLFILFVFAKVLGSTGYVSADFGDLLLPGMVALTAFITALQSVALPLVVEFSYSREIEDRLMAPLPTALVAVEKLLIALIRSLLSAVLMFPVGALVLGSAPWRAAGLPVLVLVLLLGGLTGAAIGLNLGTWLPPARVGLAFGAVMTPMMFTGATQYPWKALDTMPWFQVITACNPLTYLSEGVRGALVPGVPHMSPMVCVAVLAVAGAVLTATGLRGFQRRAVS
ncbi:ABC transporter permease [Longispora albida]|uniref:ABC transporter permease n=1 Tax=Longispora albida TaxID=203523 RepID=UPI00037AFE4A|nr:ABC transporter permease [Longispora albida]